MFHVSEILRDSFFRRFYMRSEKAAEDYVDEVVDGSGCRQYLDKVGSVSALIEPPEPIWDDQLLENQYRRFFNAV